MRSQGLLGQNIPHLFAIYRSTNVFATGKGLRGPAQCNRDLRN
jgi:hypothetical protein